MARNLYEIRVSCALRRFWVDCGPSPDDKAAPEAAIRTVTFGPVSCVECRHRGSNLPAVARQSRKHSRRSICGWDDVLIYTKQVSRIVEALNLRQPTVI